MELPSTAANPHDHHEDYYLPLYLAALKGDWEAADAFLQNDRNAASAVITGASMTALHVAAGEGRPEFVEKMVAAMPPEALEAQDRGGMTPLHHAAIGGSLRTVAALVRKNPALTNVVDLKGETPLLTASRFLYEDSDVLWFLALKTRDVEPSSPFTGPLAMNLVLMLVLSGSLDVLLYLLEQYPTLGTATKAGGASILSLLAATPSNFLSGERLEFWESCVYSIIPVRMSYRPPEHVMSVEQNAPEGGSGLLLGLWPISRHYANQVLRQSQRLFFSAYKHITPISLKRLHHAKQKHNCAVELFQQVCDLMCAHHGSQTRYFLGHGGLLYEAVSNGIVEIVRILFQRCPDLMWVTRGEDTFPIHIAIRNRQETIFSILRQNSARFKIQSDRIDRTTIMHSAAKLAPPSELSSVSGAALQMQREIKWFKEVENSVHPFTRLWKNEEGKTAGELFTEEHRELASAGEKWMKDTSNSCSIVAALIATVMFAAIFTVPGGNDGDTGIPTFIKTDAFLVFAVSDGLALFSSLTAVMMFLSILTARYSEEDFIESLPKRMIVGLSALFLAITTMMIAFGATLSIVLTERLRWITFPIVLLSSFLVTLFISLQLPLFIQMIRSTSGNPFRPQTPFK